MTTYIEQQMLTVCPTPVDNRQFFRIQIRSDTGQKTNWLNITPDQFRKIERMLIDDEKEKLREQT